MKKEQENQMDLTATHANWERENAELYPQLTNKNAEFMRHFKKEMANHHYQGDLLEKENEMLHELVEKQATGVTAKHLYGTPHGYATALESGKYAPPAPPSPFWHYIVEGGLLIGGAFALINGIMLLLNANATANQSTGIMTLLMNFVVGGFAMAIITKNQPDLNKPKGERGMGRYIMVALAVMLVWVMFISLTTFLPDSLNPVLPPFIYIVLGVGALAGRWWFKKEFKVTGTLF